MYSNTAFIPQPSAVTPGQAAVAQLYNRNPDTEIFSKGVYNWANSDRDPQCADEASRIFGQNLIDPTETDYAALMIGDAVLTRSGCSANPEAYFRAQGWTVPTGYGDYTNLTRIAGQRIMEQARANYDDYQKRLAEYRKAMTDSLNALPGKITDTIYTPGALGAEAVFHAKQISPEDLQSISKFYDKDKAVESHQRALTAWASFSGFMHSTDTLQSMTRENLRDIAAILTDESGNTDPLALAVLSLLAERRATAMQSENPEAWSIFADSLQNWGARMNDQDAKDKAAKWNTMVQGWQQAGIDQEQINQFSDKRYNDQAVETLYGSLQQALDTSLSPSEKADWLAKAMASAAKMTGESIVPSVVSLGIGLASRGAGFGAAASTLASYSANVAINSNSLINAAVAEAYRTGKANPEIYGRQEGSAQAITEGAFDISTSLPGVSKLVGKISNKAAATAAGSRFLTNQYARATLNYLGAGTIQGIGELAEEEMSGKLAATLNELARKNGINLTPRQYTFGESLAGMKSYEIAGIFGYTYALGLFGIPADYRRARTFAQNTDNLLKAGHSPAAVRDIQSHLFEAEDKIAAVYADNTLSKEEQQKQVAKINQDFFAYQQKKAQSDIWDVDPEIIRKRLEKENKKTLTESELALAIRNDIHTRIFKDAGIIDSTAIAGDKYQLTFIQKGEKNADGSESPAKITTQEWTSNQLVNWLQIKEAEILDSGLRRFQSLVQAHAGAQTITLGDLRIEFQNMRETPLAAFAALEKHNAMSEEYIREMAITARNMLQSSMDSGMTAQEAAQQPSGVLRGVSLGEVAKLDTSVAERKEQASQTSEGESKGITADASVSFPAMNIRRADGSYLIAYVAGDTNINDMLEDMLETHIKHQLTTGQITRNQLAGFLKEVDSHLPGKSILPKNKTDYSMSDLVEAYSSLAMAHYLYNEQYLPLTQGGHQLMRNIGRVVDTARTLKTLGDSWFTYANSEEGKAYLADSGKDLMSIMQEAGFTFGNILAQARATAQHEQDVRETRNWQPAIEEELDALLEQAEEESELAEINQQEAKEPITIPADQSITGKEIVVDPVEEARNESEKRKLIEYYKWAIARDKKNLLESKRDLKTAKDAQARIRKALDKNNFRSKEEKDFVAYTLEHKVELESELQEDIVRLEKAIESNEAELEKIDSHEIIVEKSSEQETLVSSPDDSPSADLTGEKATTILSHMRDLIAKGKARAEHFAIVFREIPGLTEAQAIEQGIRPLTQRGEPTAAYTQGKLLAERCTDVQYQLLKSGKLPQKAKRDILGAPTQTRKNPAWPKIAKKGIAPAEQRLTIIKALQNAVDYAAENPNYNLNFTRHIITKGREYYIATDGRRLAVIERTAPKGSKDIEESLDKNGNVVKDAKFPESWRHVLIALTDKAQTLDLAPFRYLETYPKTAINHVIWQDSKGKLSKYNPNYIGKGIKFFSTLSKAIGSPSTIQVDNQNMGPILMQSDHDGWTAKYLLMPMRLVDGDIYKEGDILLNPQDDSPANFSIKAEQISTATESADLFTDGVLEAQNAIVTQPDVNFSIKAMHASPHNFRKFSTEFMGSGEGAQAYGWGLYFMEEVKVNKEYFQYFNDDYQEKLYQGENEISEEALRVLVHDTLMKHGGSELVKDMEDAMVYSIYREGAQRQLDDYIIFLQDSKEDVPGTLEAIRELASMNLERKRVPKPATNYRVELNADDTNLLMWDERYSGQEIKDLLGEELFEQIYDEGDEEATLLDNGEGIYMLLRSVLGGKEEASKKLLESGVKGIKYLDGNSRSAGEGTYNYVIFSGDDIKITAVNESGIWSMDEGWEDYTDPTANFSIRAATPSTLERFTADPLGERIVHTVRTEARRYARVLGDKTPQEQAVNAIASAESIINAVDKYLHRPDKPVSRRHRNQLTKLRSIIEKYAQIIASGTPRSFKRISPAEQQELQAAIAELEAAELDTAETDPALLIEDDKRMNKRTREARSREHHRAIVREAAKGRVYKVLAAMLDTAADALDDYLKDQLLTKLHRLTATVAIKRTPGKRLKGKMTAPMYRELEQAIQLMAYSTRQKEDAIDTILTAHETLAQAIAANEDNLTRGNTLLIELAQQLEQDGTPVTAQTLTAALAAHEARVAIFADITSKNYEQTRTAANAIYHIIRYGRALWQQKHEAREAEIQTYLRHFLANTTAEQGKANAIRNMLEKFKWTDALSLNATMNAAQTLLALSSYEPLRPIMQQVLENYATASVARQKHLQEMRKQELYLYARILGIKPATQAGYSDKQLRHISDQFDTFYAENNQTIQTDITVTWQERNADGILETHTSDPLRLTKWEALNLILTYRQSDYQTNAQIHGYTDEVLTKLEKFIGTELMDFGNGIQQALINDGTIAVYEEREGIPMRNNPLYWPGNININTLNTTREEPLVNPYHPAAGHDFLHTRVRHRNEIAHLNAFTVWRKAVADRANYIYSDPVTSHLESLLARQQFAGRLKTLIGEGLYRQLKATIAEIKNASWQETTLQDVNNTIVATAFASKSLAVLSGNPSSLIRQASAIANAGLMPGIMPGLTTAKYMKYAIGLKQGQGYIGISGILQLDSFTTRKRDNAYVNEMLAMGNDVKFSRLMDWAKAGMNWMDKLDLLANAFSAAIVYNHKYDELKTLGTLTEDQIKKQCENAVAVYTKLLAQPLNRTDKSALYWQLGNHALGRAVLFMSSESINKIGMLRANYIRMRNQGKNPVAALGILLGTMGITVGLTAAITEAALAILTGSLPDDDDNIAAWATALWLNASYGQYLGSLPLIGGVSDSIFSPYGGYFSGDLRLPGQDTIRYGGKLIEMLTDNKTYTAAQWEKETTRLMRDFTAILGFAGGAYSRWQTYSRFAAFSHSLTAALNVLYPIARGVEARTGTSTRKRKPRRSKSLVEQWLTPDNK